MALPDEWTRAHDLALVFIALAYGTDEDIADAEMARISNALDGWMLSAEAGEAQEVTMEVLAVFMEEGASEHDLVLDALRRLFETLSPAERARALEDAISIAEADGRLLGSERAFIHSIAEAWHLKSHAERRLAASKFASDGDWTLLHDVGMMYIVVAHASDENLVDSEIKAMVERLREWQPGLDESGARGLLRRVLQRYAEAPGALEPSAERLAAALPALERLAVVSDLYAIAEADHPIVEAERAAIMNLKEAWGFGRARLN